MGLHHCLNNPTTNCYWVDTKAAFGDWHTVTLEWSPGRITYLLDGRTVGTTTSSVPSRPMRWILQTESNGSTPNPAVAGHVLIDWVTIHTWTG